MENLPDHLREMGNLPGRLRDALSKLDPSLCFVEQEHTHDYGYCRFWVPESGTVESAATSYAEANLSAIKNNGEMAPSRELWIGPIEQRGDAFSFLTTWPLALPTEPIKSE